MPSLLELGVPLASFAMMWIVGLGLAPEDFTAARVPRRSLLLGAVLQTVLVPLAAWIVLVGLEPPAHAAAGLIILAASPSGALANVFATVARANAALSLSLTALSCGIAVFALPPLVAAGFGRVLSEVARPEAPIATMIGQLALLVGLPVALGMLLRARAPGAIARVEALLRPAGLALLVVLMILIIAGGGGAEGSPIRESLGAGALFTVLAGALGWGAGAVAGLPRGDRLTLAMVFGARNVPIAGVVAIAVLGRPDFGPVLGAYLGVQIPIALAAIAVFRMGEPRPVPALSRR